MNAAMRVSVVVPTYNASARLKMTIDSVLAQTEPALEIIVIDDGSTDDTREVCARFGGLISYQAITNGGQQRARNFGVEQSAGDWIAFLDHDDLWHPDYLAELRTLHERHAIDMSFCNSRTVRQHENGNVIQNGTRFTELAPPGYWQGMGADTMHRWTVLERYGFAQFLAFHPVQPSVTALRKDLFHQLGGFNPCMRGSSAEDFEFGLRAIRVARVGLIWHPLATITRHAGNASADGSKMAMDLVDCLRFARTHHDLFPVEMDAVETELQRRLPSAIDGAFTLRRFQKLLDYRTTLSATPDLKTRIKSGIARLPEAIAHRCADAITKRTGLHEGI